MDCPVSLIGSADCLMSKSERCCYCTFDLMYKDVVKVKVSRDRPRWPKGFR